MLAVRIPEKLENRLISLSEKKSRSKSYLVRKALENYIEDQEDYLDALEVLEEGEETIPYELIRKELGLED